MRAKGFIFLLNTQQQVEGLFVDQNYAFVKEYFFLNPLYMLVLLDLNLDDYYHHKVPATTPKLFVIRVKSSNKIFTS